MGSCAKYLRKVQQMDLWNSKIDNVMFISKPFRFSLNFSLSLSLSLFTVTSNNGEFFAQSATKEIKGRIKREWERQKKVVCGVYKEENKEHSTYNRWNSYQYLGPPIFQNAFFTNMKQDLHQTVNVRNESNCLPQKMYSVKPNTSVVNVIKLFFWGG